MIPQPGKMSEILKEMAERLLRNPDEAHSSEAMHVALMFANIAWNETVGLGHARKGYRSAWEHIEAENPEMWSEFKSNDVDAMIDDLVQFKKQHYPDDQRRILTCGIPNGNVRVEWLAPAAPGVDWVHPHGQRRYPRGIRPPDRSRGSHSRQQRSHRISPGTSVFTPVFVFNISNSPMNNYIQISIKQVHSRGHQITLGSSNSIAQLLRAKRWLLERSRFIEVVD